MGVAVVAAAAAIHTRHHHRTVEERRVGEGVLLIHQRLLHLRRQVADRLRRKAAAIAVGNVVACGPADVVKVGDVCRRRGAREGRYLLVVAHNKQVGGRRVGSRSVGVLTCNIGLYGRRGSAHTRVVGIDNIGQEPLAALPLHEGVQLPAEHAVGHNQVAQRSGIGYRLGVEAVEGHRAAGESRRVVALEEAARGRLVRLHIAHRDRRLAAHHQLPAHGIVTHRVELQARQPAVAGNAHSLHLGANRAVESIGRVDFLVERQRIRSSVGLAARRLHGHHLSADLQRVIQRAAHHHLKLLTQRHLDQLRKDRQVGTPLGCRGHVAVDRQGGEGAPVEGHLLHLHLIGGQHQL